MHTRVLVVVVAVAVVTDVDDDAVIVSFPVSVMAAGMIACDLSICCNGVRPYLMIDYC